MNEWREARRGGREKIFNLPGVVTLVLGVLLAIQLAMGALPASTIEAVYVELAFVPGRIAIAFWPDAAARAMGEALAIDPAALAREFEGEPVLWWTFVTYALLHASWAHLGINGVTLAAFGSPVARRFGPSRFLVFLGLTAVAGAAAHFAVHPFDLAPVVGASAAISGTMAASARFAFARVSAEGEPSASPYESARLSDLWRNRQALTFVALWFGVNLLFGLFPRATGESEQIAWEAHVGGFAAGLLLFGLLDPRKAASRGPV